jgi:hypothetical protein
MGRWTPWLLVAACSASPPPPVVVKPPSPPPSFAALAGEWAGMGYQPDAGAPVEIHMTLDGSAAIGAHAGRIEYPRSPCSGELVRIAAPPTELRMQEHLTSNPDDTCATGGTIVLPLTATDELDWKWLYPDGRVGVTATLARVR